MESDAFFFVTHLDPTGKQDLKQGGVGDCWFLSVTCRHCAKCDGISLLGSLLYRVKNVRNIVRVIATVILLVSH